VKTLSREDRRRAAAAAGLAVGDAVTEKTRLLVAADPDPMSGWWRGPGIRLPTRGCSQHWT
jgi:hypothetical protein